MPERKVQHLLIGGGQASAQCAAELRKKGADGSILLAGREPDPPYERPPLSKEYLRGEATREDAFVNERDWYADNDVELLTKTNVMSLDPEAKVAKLQGGVEVAYEQALIATGANVNLLRLDGAALDGIHYLRAFGNSDAIREAAAAAERVVLVGGSYIATEVAASLTEMGKQCALVMTEEIALSNSFGDEAGSWFHELLASKGIELHGGETVSAFEGDSAATAVVTESGKTVEGDMVVVGSGVVPDVMLAQRAGLEVDDGIVCDANLRTSAADVWAAGDVCSWHSELHGRRLRVEHWDVAFQQGMHVARAMLGETGAYREIPYFFSDLADWAGIEYVGPAESWDEVIFRGDRDAGEWSAFYVGSGRLQGALTVGRSEDMVHARRLMEDAVELADQREVLADADTELDSVS
ncbi:FAD-dependent oxidoreductase [Thermoleophilia bacterium SCSIO 60948]|nr:FAD-dependent oxidoreductase [Thermoleophilia bacterium SCSIO 60948]